MAALRRRATDALLIATAVVLTLAVAADVGSRIAFQQRMRIDRRALREYLQPRTIDAHRIDITVHGSTDLTCLPTPNRHKPRAHICVRVTHTTDQPR